MPKIYRYLLHAPRISTLLGLSVASLLFHMWATFILNNSYAASQFPVPYYEAQLSFSPHKIKGWYAFLVHNGTLARYISTQHIDSLFILSTLLLHVSVLTLISRLFALGTHGRSVMVVCALLSALAPISDQLENAVSYVMLANPVDFPGYLAYIYSSFSALKFSMFVFAYSAAAVGLAFGVFRWVMKKVRPLDLETA